MNRKKGFTVAEVAIVIVFMVLFVGFVAIQKANLDALMRDKNRKTAINAFYYSLEKDFYANKGYYPELISSDTLPTVSEELWLDPSGRMVNSPEGSYFYNPGNCKQGRCQTYILKALLEKEDTYIMTAGGLE